MKLHALSATKVSKVTEPGYHLDGGGLYLQVSKAGTKSWVFKYTLFGKTREMGLGPFHAVTLAEARDQAARCRKLLVEKIDPIEEREAVRRAARLVAARSLTFDECVQKFLEANQGAWKNVKHGAQWVSTLGSYASPFFGSTAVQEVNTPLVMQALLPIWHTKNETASRVRGRIERVLDWAAVGQFRTGENPARWAGHLEHMLPAPSKVQKVQHHDALPYSELPAFILKLADEAGVAASALEFTILTASRTNEVIYARWDEIDRTSNHWTIPAERMKAGKEHRIPLTARALAVLDRAAKLSEGGYVFPGMREGQPLSNMAMLQLLARMGLRGKSAASALTVHGFRSTFRDWAGEQTPHAREVIEHALAHQLKDKAEAAYQRGDLLAKRRRLMDDWAAYCAEGAVKELATVHPLSLAA